MLRKMLILSVSVFCISAPLVVSAQSGLSGIVAAVDKLDRNFDAADRNRDGLLDRQEATAGHVAFIVRNFDAIDSAGQGQVSKDDVHTFIQDWLLRRQPVSAEAGPGGE